ncbi:hypothetical protein [Aquimarina algicola]|uniref:Uncharacterized protein n=1 Tax=Aquimarina algicola TaxID=2589995 RepID=A0A504JB40_9FLAO|nr:hypothetical protein [Aquimarina algicola]TPN85815.1 hypothetical protein FHK87_11035 [Aquimarina algicola]
MISIKEFLKLDVEKIDDPEIKKQIQEISLEYKRAEDQAFFIESLQDSMDALYEIVKEESPQAITGNTDASPCEEPETPKTETSNPKKKKTNNTKKTTKEKKTTNAKTTKEDVLPMNEKLKLCDRQLKAYRAERRKLLPQKPPPTRYEKIRRHIVGLGKLIPPKLKDDLETQRNTKKLLMKVHRDLLKNFKMTSLRNIDRDQKAIKENFEKIEEKLEQE